MWFLPWTWAWNWATIFHIETLFIIFIVIFILGLLFNRKKFEQILNEIVAQVQTVPEFVGEGKSGRGLQTSSGGEKKKYKSEERCRELFEGIFNEEFVSVRPDWLKSPLSGKNLELDGYSPNIKTPLGKGLAFEYDGEQHSRYNAHFHVGDPRKFVHQVKNDSWKDQRCKEKGVLLIRIPHYVTYHDLDKYIVNSLRKYRLV
jgi:hypothetical protein